MSMTNLQPNRAPLGTSAVPKRRTQSDTIMRAALMNATTASLEELTRDWRRIQVEGELLGSMFVNGI